MITIFDCETTGIPLWTKPHADGAQPRIMQLAAVQFDRTGAELNRFSFLLKRDGWVSSGGAAAVHGIPERRCDLYGLRQQVVISALMDLVRNSRAIASYGLRFDRFMVEVEMARLGGVPDGWIGKRPLPIREICIMEAAAQAITGGKNVKLVDAHAAITGAPFEQNHDALEDTEAAARVFWKLVETKKIEV